MNRRYDVVRQAVLLVNAGGRGPPAFVQLIPAADVELVERERV